MSVSRRHFLRIAAAAAPVALVGLSGAARAAACYDPATLPLSQKNRRRSLGYVEAAGDPSRRCMGCAFFTAAEPGCGKCQMLNYAVNAGGSCNSFAARPA